MVTKLQQRRMLAPRGLPVRMEMVTAREPEHVPPSLLPSLLRPIFAPVTCGWASEMKGKFF